MVPSLFRSSSTRCLPTNPVAPVTKWLIVPPLSPCLSARRESIPRLATTNGFAGSDRLTRAPARAKLRRERRSDREGRDPSGCREAPPAYVAGRKPATCGRERPGASRSTLRRWAETSVIPGVGGNDHGITAAGAAHAHIVVRLRERAYPLGS